MNNKRATLVAAEPIGHAPNATTDGGTRRLEEHLRPLLGAGRLHLRYQPIISISRGRLTGLEVRGCWGGPTDLSVNGVDLIRLSDRLGLGLALLQWYLPKALKQFRTWQRAGDRSLTLSMSIPATVLSHGLAEQQVLDPIAASRMQPRDVVIEVSENTAATLDRAGQVELRHLGNAGVGLCLDQYGGGEANLRLLHQIPWQSVKLSEPASSWPSSVIASQVGVARAVGLQVGARGVKNLEQQAALAEMGCDNVQGPWLCPPLLARQVSAFVTQFH